MICCLKGIWKHPYTVTQAKLAWVCGMSVTCWVEMMPFHHCCSWYPHQTASHIRVRHMQSVWAIGMLSHRCMGAPLYHYTINVGPRFLIFLVTCGMSMMPLHDGWGWHPPQTASHIHIRYVQHVWGIGIIMLSHGPLGALLYRSTGQVGPRYN